MSDVPNAAFWTLSMLFAAARLARARNAVLAGVMAGLAITDSAEPGATCGDPGPAHRRAAGRRRQTVATDPRGAVRRGLRAVCRNCRGRVQPSLWIAVAFGVRLARRVLFVVERGVEPVGVPAIGSWRRRVSRHSRFSWRHLSPCWTAESGATDRLLYFFFVVAVVGCYLFYTSFEEWWYLRFLLPAFPFVFVLGADAVSTIAARFGPVAQHVALVVFGALLMFTGFAESSGRHVLSESEGDRRYADAAAYVQTSLAPGAVVTDDAAQRKSGVLL